ncbi:MAG: ABC transporter ATP-binding protein [Bifidobacteriaceae bacterium]|jgi:ABC-type multidrug transport system ATPase subunit|nr:ABC transporter ATP-binding protein [Bifidobacteriaceae bacterium]
MSPTFERGEPIVSVRELSVRYGRRTVVSQVDLSVAAGEIVGLTGANGSGKSTILKALALVAPIGSGRYYFHGSQVTTAKDIWRARGRIGYLPQEFESRSGHTVRDTVVYAAWLRGMRRAAAVTAAGSAIEELGLVEESRRALKTLSVGTIRRVGVACAMVGHPEVLVLDEPDAGVDSCHLEAVLGRITAASRDCGVVLATHSGQTARAVCSRLLVIEQGRVAFGGRPDEVLDRREARGLGRI